MTRTTYEPCRCGCQPLVLTGCGCPVCLTGKRPVSRHRSLREVLGAAGIDTADPKYCPKCNNIVLVTSEDKTGYWYHMCKKKGHAWVTDGPI